MPISFASQIKPLFRDIDVAHMKRLGVLLDDFTYMSDASNNHKHAQSVLDTLTSHKMPPGGPFWTQDNLDLFAQWMSEGYNP
jgi:hypothetical protein